MIKTLDLRTLGLAAGTHTITVVGKKAYYVQSDRSAEALWTPDAFPITYTIDDFISVVSAPESILEGHTAILQFSMLSELVTPVATVAGATFTEQFNLDTRIYTLTLSNPVSAITIDIVSCGEITTNHMLNVATKDDAAYGFNYVEGSGLVPQNKGMHNSYAWTKIPFTLQSEGTITMTVYQSSEQNHDYGLVSNIDTLVTKDYSNVSTNVYNNCQGLSGTKAIVFNNVSAGDHFVTAKYRKDGSVNTGSDEFRITSLVSKCLVDLEMLPRVSYNIDEQLTALTPSPILVLPHSNLQLQYRLPYSTYIPKIEINHSNYEETIEDLVLSITIQDITNDLTISITEDTGNIPQLDPATIELDGDILKIYDMIGHATSATIFVNGEAVQVVNRENNDEEPLDPGLNHQGVIPEGCWYYNDDAGTQYSEGEPFPALINGDWYENLDGLRYYYSNGSWSCDEAQGAPPINPVILESINGAPVTTLAMIYHGGIGADVSQVETITIPKSITSISSYAFAWPYGMHEVCDNFTTIIYAGTMEQWNTIELASHWNYGCNTLTVTCTDGTITIPAYGS